MASNDPQFAAKAKQVIGLYLRPPQEAAVFCVDEKSAIQALDRVQPLLPLRAGPGSGAALNMCAMGPVRSMPLWKWPPAK